MKTERPAVIEGPAGTVGALLRWAGARLAGAASPALDAELLLGFVLQRSRAWLMTWPERPVAAADATLFRRHIERRATGYPVAYITGQREFWSLTLHVTPATLVPRPDTELLVEATLAALDDRATPVIADLGTGSGAVALALASELPAARILATDICPLALAVARDNAKRLALTQVEFFAGRWLDPVCASVFDAIVSNPPYVAPDTPDLISGALRHEPRSALAGRGDGLDDARDIVAGAWPLLRPGGIALLEHGEDQGRSMRDIFRRNAFVDIATRRDLAGHERVTSGRRPNNAA